MHTNTKRQREYINIGSCQDKLLRQNAMLDRTTPLQCDQIHQYGGHRRILQRCDSRDKTQCLIILVQNIGNMSCKHPQIHTRRYRKHLNISRCKFVNEKNILNDQIILYFFVGQAGTGYDHATPGGKCIRELSLINAHYVLS